MKSHREFVEEQLKDADFTLSYEKAKQAVAFAVSLARLREERGFTQKSLEEKTGIRQPVIARYEKGAIPSVANLQKIARALNASVTIQPTGAVTLIRASARKRLKKPSLSS